MATQETTISNDHWSSHSTETVHDWINIKLLDKPLYFTNTTHEVWPVHIKPLHIPQEINIPSTLVWWGLITLVFALLALYLSNIRKNNKYSKLAIGFDLFYEKITNFFEDILGSNTKPWIKSYVASVFFVIFFSNILALALDFFILPLPQWAHHIIKAPTTSLAYTLAMAICSVIVILITQIQSHWIKNFFLEYFPITWKGFLKAENKPWILGMLSYLGAKIFDILISLFLWLLEVVGLLARVISLAARLFGNMFAHGVLILTIVALLSTITRGLIWLDMPVWIPVIIYLQWMLVWFIQAFVFSLLVSIFIKVATTHEEEHEVSHA